MVVGKNRTSQHNRSAGVFELVDPIVLRPVFPEIVRFETKRERIAAYARAWSSSSMGHMRRRRHPRIWSGLMSLFLFAVWILLCVRWGPRFINSFLSWLGPVCGWLVIAILVLVSFLAGPSVRIHRHRHRIRTSLRWQLLQRGIPICPTCGYDLRGQVRDLCPECGANLGENKDYLECWPVSSDAEVVRGEGE